MRLKIVILVLLIAICGAADALTFVQEVSVSGNGNLSAKTTTDGAKDDVVGNGEQNYSRNLNLEEGSTTLVSEYHLISNLEERKNRYYAQVRSSGGLEHFISVYSSSDINALSSMSQSGYSVETDYEVEAKMAELSEAITDVDKDSYNDDKKQSRIVETEATGNVVLTSKLSDDGGVKERDFGWNASKMLEDLDRVAKSAETPPPADTWLQKLQNETIAGAGVPGEGGASWESEEIAGAEVPEVRDASLESEEIASAGVPEVGGALWESEDVEDFDPSKLKVRFKGLPLGRYSEIYRTGDNTPKTYTLDNNVNDSRPMIFLGGSRV
jgi:hypothetical protein